MASFTKLNSGNWRCRSYAGIDPTTGKRIVVSGTGATKSEAEMAMFAVKSKVASADSSMDMTLRQAMGAYIKARSGVLSPSTIRGYYSILNSGIQSIMDLRLKTLNAAKIQTAISEDAKTKSPKTVRNIYGLLVPTLEMFAPGLKVDIKLPQKIKTEMVIPTDEEIKQICDRAEHYRCKWQIYLAAFMGLRVSEIIALDLNKDIDWENSTLTVNKAMVRNENSEYVLKTTKTVNSTRKLKIPPFVLDVLKATKDQTDPIYFPKSNELGHRMKRIVNSLKLEKKITMHTLRHYYASTLVVLGVPDLYAIKLMGHGSEGILRRVYQHTHEEYLDSVQDKMIAFFSDKYQT